MPAVCGGLTQEVLFGEIHLQLLAVEHGAGRLVAQDQVRGDLGNGHRAAGVVLIHQQAVWNTSTQSHETPLDINNMYQTTCSNPYR